MKKTILITFLIVAVAAGVFVWQNFMNTGPSMKRLDAVYRLNAIELYQEYDENEDAATVKYGNRIVELVGELESIEMNEGSNTVINLKTEGFGLVKCTLESDLSSDELNELELNSTLLIKGECIGYLLDVLIERAIILDPS